MQRFVHLWSTAAHCGSGYFAQQQSWLGVYMHMMSLLYIPPTHAYSAQTLCTEVYNFPHMHDMQWTCTPQCQLQICKGHVLGVACA